MLIPNYWVLVQGGDDFTIYVNGTAGNDANNGLTVGTAKQTIQSAVDSLPECLFCNVTIDVADGVYREEVKVFGIFVEPGKKLTFLGDESWTPSSSGDPSVRITGNDNDTTATKVRDYAFMAQQCSNVIINGFLFDNANYTGVDLRQGSISVYNSKSAYNTSYGFTVDSNCRVTFNGCKAEYNDKNGFHVNNNCAVNFKDCAATNNGRSGIVLNQLVNAVFSGSGKFSNNGYTSGPSGSTHNGLTVNNNSRASFGTYTGEIKDNAQYGIQIRYDSFTQDHTKNTITGNLSGITLINNGGHTYF